MSAIKTGSTVKLVDTKGLSGYGFYRKILKIKNKPIKVRRVKTSGGILLEGFELGYNMFGEEQGLTPDRFELVKVKTKTKKKK